MVSLASSSRIRLLEGDMGFVYSSVYTHHHWRRLCRSYPKAIKQLWGTSFSSNMHTQLSARAMTECCLAHQQAGWLWQSWYLLSGPPRLICLVDVTWVVLTSNFNLYTWNSSSSRLALHVPSWKAQSLLVLFSTGRTCGRLTAAPAVISVLTVVVLCNCPSQHKCRYLNLKQQLASAHHQQILQSLRDNVNQE